MAREYIASDVFVDDGSVDAAEKWKSAVVASIKAFMTKYTIMSNCRNIIYYNIGNVGFDISENKKEFQNTKEQKTILNGIDGCMCAKCKSFIPYAEPNMDDGTMVCYSCRSSGGL